METGVIQGFIGACAGLRPEVKVECAARRSQMILVIVKILTGLSCAVFALEGLHISQNGLGLIH